MIRVQHRGFQGYEHRAAAKYLSKHGISTPSAPILAPEFTNPLFLKACCESLKIRNETSFPKGLRGVTSLFEFYLQSVEGKIAKTKQYSPAERIIEVALKEFASKLFPDHLGGIPNSEARDTINNFDPAPRKGDPFFNELLQEGILSEDIAHDVQGVQRPVIRFTYERFSDHIIAQGIVEQFSAKNNIDQIFSKDWPLGKMVMEGHYYRLAGIFEALAILVAEKFNLELADLLPDEHGIAEWSLDEMFSNTILWRSVGSFTDRTLALLNGLSSYEYEYPIFEVLLRLSTEPDHPWNAEFLHNNLIRKSMPERDHFWSIYVALGDQEEDTEQSETVIRTLIQWSCFGDISATEEERARLCAVSLFWLLTTSNRKVRDQSTKSLVRLLSKFPSLLPELIIKFQDVDDMYLIERLYAVTYGVVCNISNGVLISEIAKVVFDQVFKDGKPIPHILLRDYARGVMELALNKNILPKKIKADSFRPPYNSEWPIENPPEMEIDALLGEDKYSHIHSSLIGDFGTYTMGGIHDWSPTVLSETKPETGYELKKKFAEQCLKGKLKERYLDEIKPAEREVSDIAWVTAKLEALKDKELMKIIQKDREIKRKKQ